MTAINEASFSFSFSSDGEPTEWAEKSAFFKRNEIPVLLRIGVHEQDLF